MSNGIRSTQTVTTTTEIITYTYPGLISGSDVTVTVSNGVMVVDAPMEGVAWNAVLPLTAAPLMVAIAADMTAELAAQPATQTGATS